jgi:large conductance mechanosensitive channel
MATKKHAAKVKSARATTSRKKPVEQKPVATKRSATIKDKVSVTRQVQGFVEFLREQSVVGLAIGLVLGTQAKALVDQLMLSFINPLTGLLLPGEGTLKQKTFTVELSGKSAEFGWGAFVSSLMTFVIVAAVVYYVFKGLGLDKLDKKKED